MNSQGFSLVRPDIDWYLDKDPSKLTTYLRERGVVEGEVKEASRLLKDSSLCQDIMSDPYDSLYLLIVFAALYSPIRASEAPLGLLILQNINEFKFMGSGGGKGAGVVISTGHFNRDHEDNSFEAIYYNNENELGITAQVTQHAGSNSDKWLLHELDSGFRNKIGLPAESYYPWQIDSQTILINAVGGREYRWLSGNKVIMIQYHGSLTQQPEPKEVVKAYLMKHASTLPALTLSQLRSAENTTKWLKDEMERRLWLCDKWIAQQALGSVDLKEILRNVVKSMNVFLDYRERYYGKSAKDEKNAIEAAQHQGSDALIKTKLGEYQRWWSANKGAAINMP